MSNYAQHLLQDLNIKIECVILEWILPLFGENKNFSATDLKKIIINIVNLNRGAFWFQKEIKEALQMHLEDSEDILYKVLKDFGRIYTIEQVIDLKHPIKLGVGKLGSACFTEFMPEPPKYEETWMESSSGDYRRIANTTVSKDSDETSRTISRRIKRRWRKLKKRLDRGLGTKVHYLPK